jgi:hypothetical protein
MVKTRHHVIKLVLNININKYKYLRFLQRMVDIVHVTQYIVTCSFITLLSLPRVKIKYLYAYKHHITN